MINCTDTKLTHLPAVAQCHISAFPDSLSSQMGRSYCSKMLSWYIQSDRGVLFHISIDDQILGYCGGIMNRAPGQPGSATSMTQHTFGSLILNLLIRPWLICHKEIRESIPLISRNIKMKLSLSRFSENSLIPDPNNEFIPSMGLVVIGVSHEHQGKGYGSMLLREFESRALKEGFKKIYLTVKKNNYPAITAYHKNGWQINNEGLKEYSMHKQLD